MIAHARALISERGIEGLSLNEVLRLAGGSKATLYGYFESKKDLLRGVLEYDVANEALLVLHEFPAGEDLRKGLVNLGIQFLTGRLAALPIANTRTLAGLPTGSTMGKEFYETILRPAWQTLADHGRSGMGGTFIHPVADRAVMAGNGTIGLEIAKRAHPLLACRPLGRS